MVNVQQRLGVSERLACRVLGQQRSNQRRIHVRRDVEGALTEAVVRLAGSYGQYGYRRITAMLRAEGWHVNHKRVECIWAARGAEGSQEAAQERASIAQ